MTKPFVHLHLHTKYSMLDGACHLDALCRRAAELEMPAVAMTDHGVMYGAVDFFNTCKSAGIKPIIGCEVYVLARAPLTDRSAKTPYHHLVLLAVDEAGYFNLARLNSHAFLKGFYHKPRLDKQTLREHAQGLIALTACLKGEVNELLAERQLDAAEAVAREHMEIFGPENFFLEMQDHGIPAQRVVNEGVRELRRRTGLRAVVTNDVHYLLAEHAAAHEVMLAIQTGTVMSDPRRLRYEGNQFYFKSRAELERLFPNDGDALDASVEIAERCNAKIPSGGVHFPKYDLPAGCTAREHLVSLGHEGLRRHYGILDCQTPRDDNERRVLDRFNFEVEIIDKTKFLDYFLVVADFVRHARSRGIPVGPGRGSGGGSVVAYTLDITQFDPLRYNLIFERFLNPARVSPPDFDIDFCQSRRDEIITYVKQKYGADRVAQIVTFGQLGAKTVIRDVARVLEVPLDRANAFTKLIPEDPKITLSKAREANPAFGAACASDPDLRRILPYAEVLEGLYRNTGVHAAGVVIGDQPLVDIVPLARDKDGSPVTQYAKEPIEACGLLKMDMLGLKTLTVLQEAVDLVRESRGITLQLDSLPLDDAPTFGLLVRAETIGVFQLESGGMRQLLREIGVQNIEEIIAVISLFRPGPMDMLPSYTARKCGKEPLVYDHPLLEPILKDTYGVMVYQEQVQRAANVLAGYSLGEADLLRRAMGKKDHKIMAKERERFVDGCRELNQIPKALAGSIFDNIAKFAGYGFNKAHAAAYGLITYQTAFMKANYPAEFMAAQISSEIGNFDKLPGFVNEANAMGLTVLPPDVNHSAVRFHPEANGIRYGLAGIKSVGEGAAAAILAARKEGGPFTDLVDFCARVDPGAANKRVLEALARCGAMDGFGLPRARIFGGIDFALARASERLRERRSGQGNLFESLGAAAVAAAGELPKCALWDSRTTLAGERELLGIYISGHPLDRYRSLLANCVTVSLADAVNIEKQTDARIAGLAVAVQPKINRKTKEPWAVFVLEDGDQHLEVLAFGETFARYGAVIQADQALLVCGELSQRDGQPRMMAREIYPLADAPQLFAERVGLLVRIEDPSQTERIERLHACVRRHPGKTPLSLALVFGKGRRIVIDPAIQLAVNPSSEFVSEVEALLGQRSVRYVTRKDVYRQPRPTRRFSRPSTP